MKVVGLFAGIGGIELGFSGAGHESLLLCENAPPAAAVLAARFPDVPYHRDVRELADLPADTDAVLAGFPCQDLSQAGRTAGIAGARSSLVDEIFRLLDRRRVPWLLLENVSFMLHLDRGRALARIVGALEERGWRWAYRVVNSQAFLPQRRERVFLVATTTDVDPAGVAMVDEVVPEPRTPALDEAAHGFYWTEGIRGLGWAPDAIPTLKNGSTIGIPSAPAIMLPDGRVVTPDIRDAKRLQGFPADWTLPAQDVARASRRWSLVGNAVSVPVAEWLGRRLAAPATYDRSRDRPLPKDGRWPRAARFDGTARHAVDISAFPVWRDRSPLHRFLAHEGKALSARATRGFLARCETGRLRFAPGFKERLRAHLSCMEAAENARPPRARGTAREAAVAAE